MSGAVARALTVEERRKLSAELGSIRTRSRKISVPLAIAAALFGIVAARLLPVWLGLMPKMQPSDSVPWFLVGTALLGGFFAFVALGAWASDAGRLRREALAAVLDSRSLEDLEGPIERLPWNQLVEKPRFRVWGRTFTWLGDPKALPRSGEKVRVVHLPAGGFVADVRRLTLDESWPEADLRIFLEEFGVEFDAADPKKELYGRARRFLDGV